MPQFAKCLSVETSALHRHASVLTQFSPFPLHTDPCIYQGMPYVLALSFLFKVLSFPDSLNPETTWLLPISDPGAAAGF